MDFGDLLGNKKSQKGQTNVKEVVDIANLIRNYSISKGMPQAIEEVLTQLENEDYNAVYLVCKKFIEVHGGFVITDSGFMGISDRYVQDLMYPGDIIIYLLPNEITSGDILQIINYQAVQNQANSNQKSTLQIYHYVVQSFNTNGTVNVKSLFELDKTIYTVARWQIAGKIAKVYKFGSKEWSEIFSKLTPKLHYLKLIREGLETQLQLAPKLEIIKENEKVKLITEMKSRMSKLKNFD